MAVVFGLERLDEDDVGVDVVGEHDIVVPAARADGEAAHIVGVELGDGLDAYVEFFREGLRRGRWFGRRGDGSFGSGQWLWFCDLSVGPGGFGWVGWFVGIIGWREWWRGFGGAHALARLLEVSLESFDRDEAVFRRVGVGEAVPGRVVACFDGGQPG